MSDSKNRAAGQPPVCVLTGGTSGIGLETAKRFAGEGYRIATCGRDANRLEQAGRAIAIAGNGAEPLVIALDLARPREAGQLIDRAVEAFGGVDCLIHCASVAPLNSLEAISPSEFENALDINVRSQFYLTQAVWKEMRRRGRGGIIVNVSSMSAVDPFPGLSVYGASKAWSELFCMAIAQEGKPIGIRVHSIRPGAVETPMLRKLFPNFPAAEALPPRAVADFIWAVCHDAFQDSSGYPLTIKR